MPMKVTLTGLSQTQFTEWLASSIAGYAQEKIESGNWSSDEAEERARKEYEQLLPDGLASKNNHIYSIYDADRDMHVGVLWIAILEKSRPAAWIYDVIIFDPYRRHGYGLEAMLALESEVIRLGLSRIELHVFAHNQAAQDLYTKAGYKVTNVIMAKDITS